MNPTSYHRVANGKMGQSKNVVLGQWSRLNLSIKWSMVKVNFCQVKTLTAASDRPTVCMRVTPPWLVGDFDSFAMEESRNSSFLAPQDEDAYVRKIRPSMVIKY